MPAQAIQGSIFRAPLQGLNALAPSASQNFSGQVAAAEVAAAAARGAPPNSGSTPVRVPLGPSDPGQYAISATKQNTTNITINGPQVTSQVGTAQQAGSNLKSSCTATQLPRHSKSGALIKGESLRILTWFLSILGCLK